MAWADTLTLTELHLIQGKVLVNNGRGYRLSGSANTGDSILIGDNSSAILTFSGGSDIQLQPNQVYIVPAVSPCAVAYVPPPQVVPPPPAPPPTIDPTTAIIGAGVVGAAAVGAGAYLLFVSKS
ncbi:MAG: hypothetical protein M3O03_13085 [Pseudomonadota bacterium]|nr:hypothetical protein [Pseudomonadota bacterium]